jgi:hypothetical protein
MMHRVDDQLTDVVFGEPVIQLGFLPAGLHQTGHSQLR